MSNDDIYSRLLLRMLTPCKRMVPIGGNYYNGYHAVDGHKYVCLDDLIEDIKRKEVGLNNSVQKNSVR